jgi:ferredoxin/flavodoxin
MDLKIFVVFSSPAGSTRLVAETIKDAFIQQKVELDLFNLGLQRDTSGLVERIHRAGNRACLFIGSPVYRDAAVPPIVNFIETLPKITGAMAVPFVTWGHACSGVALWQMANLLMKKGFKIVAAAKVVAAHSLMWQAADPAGKGHPDQTDLDRIKDLVVVLQSRFESADIPSLELETLDYQPAQRTEQMKKKIEAPRLLVPKKVNPEACTQCGVCEEACPAAAISLNPYPGFDHSCFDCFNCVRLCPEDAIEPAVSLQEMEQHIRQRVSSINEQPLTQIFL